MDRKLVTPLLTKSNTVPKAAKRQAAIQMQPTDDSAGDREDARTPEVLNSNFSFNHELFLT
jgi:hypothetical protein